MPYVIRHKATGEIVKMRSGKSVWEKEAHAKASFKTSGLRWEDRARFDYSPDASKLDSAGYSLGRKAWMFDNQDIFEIVEAKVEVSEDMKQAMHLLKEATFEMTNPTLIYQINKFLREVKQ